jgi:5-methylthioadenosine/S-adenosylhomocysteine deaminase
LILRPIAIIQNGDLRHGLEVVVVSGRISEIRPLTGKSEPYILSSAFVNAHSHLEYRGMLGKVHGEDFPSWIRAITMAKAAQTMEEVRADCFLAAQENRATGVALMGEHSDRPFAREAMMAADLSGPVFQELITFNEQGDPSARWAFVRSKAEEQAAIVSPHAPYTVDEASLIEVGKGENFLSIHASESPAEHELFVNGSGAFAEMYARFDVPLPRTGLSPVRFLDDVGFLKPARQLVHCCTVDGDDLDLMAERDVVVAHCPRSNATLNCPSAPVREMLDRGIAVGIGLDSCASSGPIDMFAEMTAALDQSEERGRPLTGTEVWRMATVMGARTLLVEHWDVVEGSFAPLIAIDIESESMVDLIRQGKPELVRWISPND